MYPYFFQDSLHISSYTTLFCCALIIIFLGSRYGIKKHTIWTGKQIAILLFFSSIGGIVGARLLHIITRRSTYSADQTLMYDISIHGFSGYGGILGACLVGLLICWGYKTSPFRIADIITPYLGMGITVMRIGCFLHGCCFGKPTTLPRGVTFPQGSEVAMHQFYENLSSNTLFFTTQVQKVHPTQLYDALLALTGGIISYLIWKKGKHEGIAFVFFLLWYTLGRYLLAQFRAPSVSFDASNVLFPIIYIVTIVLALVALIIFTLYTNKK